MSRTRRISPQAYAQVALLVTLLALLVSTVGAYVRLSDAGLSCPDWPGCYGRLVVPGVEFPKPVAGSTSAAEAEEPLVPGSVFDRAGAWKEMIHRYLAGLLGVSILLLVVLAWRRRQCPGQQVWVPVLLLALVIGQAALGMWTVTLLLAPIVVLGHLLGGLTTTALLWWLSLRQGRWFLPCQGLHAEPGLRRLRPWVGLALVVVFAQLALGGWTSANYAALACPDLPLCQGQVVPSLDFAGAFALWPLTGGSFEGGVLDNDARVTIHLLHRIGAVVTVLIVGAVAVAVLRAASNAAPVLAAGVVLAVLAAQFALGVSNVALGLPIEVAAAHSLMASLLLLSVVTVYHMTRPPQMSV